MNNYIKGLGNLKADIDIGDWMCSEEIEIPFFDNKKVQFIVTIKDDWGDAFWNENELELEEKISTALKSFLELDLLYKEKVSKLVYENYNQAIKLADIEHLSIKNSSDVWKFVSPKAIYIKYRDHEGGDVGNNKMIYFQVDLQCEWEKEHGLVLVFKEGKQLVRVDEFDGHLTKAEACAIPDSEDSLLSNPL